MRLKRFGILFILFSLFAINSFAQSSYQNYVPNVFGKSPTSASFTKYGDYPTNLFSGLPDISIPLYTIESGGLKVPITLSYHASGIKVGEGASWVGLGWTLSSGGAISRTVYGWPDENGGYFYHYTRPQSYSQSSTQDVSELYANVVNKSSDTRPDIFSYNLPGYNGKFFFSALDSYKVKMIPYSPLRITNTAADMRFDTPKFSVLDEHGNSYLLGYQYREISSTTTTSSRPSVDATTSWMLENMVSQNKRDTIRFTYTPQGLRLPEQTGQTLNVEDQGVVNNGWDGGTYATNNWLPQSSYTSVNVTEQDPKEIFFKNGKVVFRLNDTARTDLRSGNNSYALDTIQVYMYDFSAKKYETRPQKSIVFKRGYFPVMSGEQARMRLNGIQILDKAGSIVQEYKFTYDATPLPGYWSYSKDFWGYYNGKMDDPLISPKTLIPRMRIFIEPGNPAPGSNYWKYIGSTDSTSRLPDTIKMQAGILKRIDYPTGGHTDFTYETNRFVDDSLTIRFTGGLRIASIASYSTQTGGIPILKTYKYNSARPNYLTNGTNFLNYGFFSYTLPVIYLGSTGPAGITILRKKRTRNYYSESSSALTSSDGNPVAYTKVTEYIGDPVTNIGKTEYTYQQTPDEYSAGSQTTGLPVQMDLFFKRGQLLRKTDYIRKSNGSYQISREELNDYSAFDTTQYAYVGVIAGQRRQAESGSGYPQLYLDGSSADDMHSYSYPWSGYTIVSGDSYPTASTTKIYDQNDVTKFQSSTVEYKYDNFKHQQVSRIRTTDSKGNTKVTVNRYPADYLIGAATSTNNSVLDAMLAGNMQAEQIERWDSVKNVSTSLNAIVGAQLNVFQTGNQSVLPDEIRKLRVSTPLTDFVPATFLSGNIITTDNRYVQMVKFDKYIYNDNSLLQYTPRNGGPTSIIWDYNNAYPVAQIKNAVTSTILGNRNSAYSSFEADGNGNWTISGTPVVDQFAPTGHKVYPLTSGSLSFVNGDFSKPHTLTYWSDNGAASVYMGGSNYAGVALKVANGWTLFKHNLPSFPSTQTLSISGSSKIDELKTYPSDAQMTTYTFDTDGLTETTDEKEQISRFEYDPAQRLKNVRDWEGNIVKNYGYHNYNMTIGNDAIAATTFTRNNCPPYTVPGTTTYSVAANAYYSVTKASANALAQYNLQTNGQAKANDPAVCGCPIQYVTFTMKDQTGLGTYSAGFSGPGTVNFYPPSGTSTGQVPANNNYTLQIGAVGTQIKHFQLGSRPVITGRIATFNNVNMTPGSSDLTLTIY